MFRDPRPRAPTRVFTALAALALYTANISIAQTHATRPRALTTVTHGCSHTSVVQYSPPAHHFPINRLLQAHGPEDRLEAV